MAAYRLVYDSRHLQADTAKNRDLSSGTLRSVIEYGLPFLHTGRPVTDWKVIRGRRWQEVGADYHAKLHIKTTLRAAPTRVAKGCIYV